LTHKTKSVLTGVMRLVALLALFFGFCAAVSVFLFHQPFYHGFPIAVGSLWTSLFVRKYILTRKQ